MIATLPMYDRPEMAASNDRLWALTRDNLRDLGLNPPVELRRDIDPWKAWQSPMLFLAQTCGLPYRTKLHGKVQLIGTPIHPLDCEPGKYFSVILKQRGALPAKPLIAVNDAHSQSGWAAMSEWLRVHNQSAGQILMTGAHVASARAVATGAAHLAALDAVTWKTVQLYEDWAKDLVVLDQTTPTPALPYITGPDQDADTIFVALKNAVEMLDTRDREILCIEGVIRVPADDYLAVATPAPPVQ